MAFVKFKSGYVSHWDETITVGQLITAYQEGYHVLISIDYRDPPCGDDVTECDPPEIKYPPLFHYKKVMKADGTPHNGKATYACDAGWCRKVTLERATSDYEAAIERERLKLEEIKRYL